MGKRVLIFFIVSERRLLSAAYINLSSKAENLIMQAEEKLIV